jgi:hypothetical protein
MQGIFGGFYKLTDNMKIVNRFLKKTRRQAGSDLARQLRAGLAQIQQGGMRGRRGFEPASGSVLLAAPGGRSGTGRARPSDQVENDGRRSSSPLGQSGVAEELGFRLGVAEAHRGRAG